MVSDFLITLYLAHMCTSFFSSQKCVICDVILISNYSNHNASCETVEAVDENKRRCSVRYWHGMQMMWRSPTKLPKH